jgi:hypothetical protein
MRRYIITMLVMALLIGSLFRAAEDTGVRLMKMFGTIGVLLFGVVGTLAITRWQSRQGLKEIESALKSLEPEFLITDWSYQGEGKPDYLLVGPFGLVAVTLDDTPQSTRKKSAEQKVARARERAVAAGRWVQKQLAELSSRGKDLPEGLQDLPVVPLLVLTRRRAEPSDSAEDVTVLNAEGLARHIRSLSDEDRLDSPARIKLTRMLRGA